MDIGQPTATTIVAEDTAGTAALLFGLIWESLIDVLGSAATATLLRRSVKRVIQHGGDLNGLLITQTGFEYRYSLPASWQEPRSEPIAAVRALAQELTPLLAQMTGGVVIRRLNSIPELQRCNVVLGENVR